MVVAKRFEGVFLCRKCAEFKNQTPKKIGSYTKVLCARGHEPVEHGSSRISKVVHGAATVVTRFISDHQSRMNRYLKPGQ